MKYTQWRNFSKVIERIMIVCESNGHDVFCDFAEVGKIVDTGIMDKPIGLCSENIKSCDLLLSLAMLY